MKPCQNESDHQYVVVHWVIRENKNKNKSAKAVRIQCAKCGKDSEYIPYPEFALDDVE